ncbi:hypothetical protein SESBI_19553 [Sesbania bispinosa]|nr:hypothetical protein SESBI_19553 [Sesbania bispinosa]
MDMQSYLSKLDSLIADFDSLMPFTDNVDEHAKQHGKFFVVLALSGLPHDIDSVRNQILSSPTVPSYDTVCEQLLWLSVPQSFAPLDSASFLVSNYFTALVSNSYHRSGRGGRGGYRTRPRCNYCKRFVHVEEQCKTKANQQQPKILNVAQFTASGTSDQVYFPLKSMMSTSNSRHLCNPLQLSPLLLIPSNISILAKEISYFYDNGSILVEVAREVIIRRRCPTVELRG